MSIQNYQPENRLHCGAKMLEAHSEHYFSSSPGFTKGGSHEVFTWFGVEAISSTRWLAPPPKLQSPLQSGYFAQCSPQCTPEQQAL